MEWLPSNLVHDFGPFTYRKALPYFLAARGALACFDQRGMYVFMVVHSLSRPTLVAKDDAHTL